MGFTKKTKTMFANVKKELSEPSQSNMHMTGMQVNTVPQSDTRLEEMRKKSKSGPQPDINTGMQQNGTLGRSVPMTTSFSTGPPVPPHRATSSSTVPALGDDTFTKTPHMLTRKATQSDGLQNNCPTTSEKPPRPPPRATESSGPPAPAELVLSAVDHEPQIHILRGSEAPGNMLSQSVETQSPGFERAEPSEEMLSQAIEDQSAKIQEQSHEMNALRESDYHHVAEIEKLKDELRKEKERHAQTTQAWRKAATALSANRPEANYKVDDDTLRKDYQNIVYEVSSWVATYCVLNFDHVPESELRVFNKLTLYPQKYFGFRRTRELLLQSLVMHDLVALVLNHGLWWAGKQSAGLCVVQLALEPDEAQAIPSLLMNNSLRLSEVRDYSAWKAKTALLLSEKVKRPAVQGNIGVICADMQKLLKPFVQRTNPNAWRELEAVIYKTIALDHEFNKSRALFQVHRWSVENIGEMQFDETRMASPNGLKAARHGMDVELVLAPLVTKTGNADGEAFECLSLISPWMVVCKENRKQMQKK